MYVSILRNSLFTALVMLGWSFSCLSTVLSGHVKENQEISYTKGGTESGVGRSSGSSW